MESEASGTSGARPLLLQKEKLSPKGRAQFKDHIASSVLAEPGNHSGLSPPQARALPGTDISGKGTVKTIINNHPPPTSDPLAKCLQSPETQTEVSGRQRTLKITSLTALNGVASAQGGQKTHPGPPSKEGRVGLELSGQPSVPYLCRLQTSPSTFSIPVPPQTHDPAGHCSLCDPWQSLNDRPAVHGDLVSPQVCGA